MKEQIQNNDPLEAQKGVLSTMLREDEHLVSLLTQIKGYSNSSTAPELQITVLTGYAIGYEGYKNEIMLHDRPNNLSLDVQWQGDELRQQERIDPVYVIHDYADPVGPKKILIGWRIKKEN